MKKVKMIKYIGEFDVNGIVNYNGKGKHDGNDNHSYAKKSSDGIDYTSSNCLRQAMFNDYVPRQPGSEELKEHYPHFMGTLTGILRGGGWIRTLTQKVKVHLL